MSEINIAYGRLASNLLANGYIVNCLYVIAESPERVRLAEVVHCATCTHIMLDMAKVKLELDALPDNVVVAGLVRVPSAVVRQHEQAVVDPDPKSTMEALRQTSAMTQTLFLPANVRHAASLGRVVQSLNAAVGDSDRHVSIFAKSPIAVGFALPVPTGPSALAPARYLLDFDGASPPAGMAEGLAAAAATGETSVGVFVDLDVFYASLMQFGALASRVLDNVLHVVVARADAHASAYCRHAQAMVAFYSSVQAHGMAVLQALMQSRMRLVGRIHALADDETSEMQKIECMQKAESVSIRLHALCAMLDELVKLTPVNTQADQLAESFMKTIGAKIFL